MRFILDEGLPFRLAQYLEGAGHDIVTCAVDLPASLADREILATAYRSQRIVLTNDKDVGDLVFRDRLPHADVVLFRLRYVPIEARINAMDQILTEYRDQLDQFIVVSSQGVRVAATPGPRGANSPPGQQGESGPGN